MAPPYAADHVNIVVELSYVMSSHTHTHRWRTVPRLVLSQK